MNRIKEARRKAGIKQVDLCSRLGKSQGALSGWETGKYSPDDETWVKLSEIFNVSVDYLMGKSDIQNAESLQLFAEPAKNNQPPKPEAENERDFEILSIIAQLPPKSRDEAINYLRYLASKNEL